MRASSVALQCLIRFLHVFVSDTVANVAVSKANHVWAPFLLLFCCFGDETQVWLGDLRVVLFCDDGFILT